MRLGRASSQHGAGGDQDLHLRAPLGGRGCPPEHRPGGAGGGDVLAQVEERHQVGDDLEKANNQTGFARSEDGKIDLPEFVSWAEGLVQGMSEENKMGEDDLKQLFDLLDRDEDNFLEFSDVLAFIFSMSTQLSDEEKRIRSFRFYDR